MSTTLTHTAPSPSPDRGTAIRGAHDTATAKNRIARALGNAGLAAAATGVLTHIATIVHGITQVQDQASQKALELGPGVSLKAGELPAVQTDWSAVGMSIALPTAAVAGLAAALLTVLCRPRRAATASPPSANLHARFPRLTELQRVRPQDTRLATLFHLAHRLEALSVERHGAFVGRYLGELEEMQRQLETLAPDRDSRSVDAAFTRFEQALVSTNTLLEHRRERDLFDRTSPLEVTERVSAEQLPARKIIPRNHGGSACST